MRTNIVIDELLIERALQLSKAKTKKEVVTLALTNFVNMLERRQLLALRGQVDWEGDINQMRQP